jgi:ABC-type nickel/cobalt efflux system permease component RcnA
LSAAAGRFSARAAPFGIGLVVGLAGLVAATHPALAQAHNPFGVGISEGGGAAGGITGWIIQEQVVFERQLSAAVRATRTDGSAAFLLAALSFAYGVFHAAGPGHGKAVIASYLFANERALRRGLVLSLLAAVLQGAVAIALVGVLALVLHATAQRMKDAASLVESLSYAGIALLGAWLVWQKGRRFLAALTASPLAIHGFAPAVGLPRSLSMAAMPAFDPLPAGHGSGGSAHVHGPDCGHYHAPDPRTLGDDFSWREAAITVVAAGSRPCSGAILVLVFAMAQGLFATGVVAVVAMSLGTAITTGALASLAVLARGLAMRLAPADSRRGTLVLRGLETLAACLVLLAGLSLFLGFASIGGA